MPDPSCLRFQPTSFVWLCIVAPFAADKQRTGKEEEESSAPEGTIKLVDMAGRYSFLDGEEWKIGDADVECVFCR